MRHYLAVNHWIKRSKTYGYSTYEMKMYQIKNNRLIRLGLHTYTTGYSKGPEGEAMDFLLANKNISKKLFDLSSGPNTGSGYYVPNKRFDIKIV